MKITRFENNSIYVPSIGLHKNMRLLIEINEHISLSIVKGDHSYGGPEGLYETAVIKDDEIQHDTVDGWKTLEDVNKQIEELNANSNT